MRTLRYAVRTLLRTPALTAVALLSLALGIGANAAVFSLFDQLLRRPLPVRDPGRLVNISSPGLRAGNMATGAPGGADEIFSYPMFRDLERAAPRAGLAGLAAHVPFGANVAFRRQTLDTQGAFVSGAYFPLLGLAPALGRLLGPADDGAPGAHPAAVLSHAYWTAHLGADPGVLGQTVLVNGRPLTVVGVAPRGFAGTTLGTRPDVFVPVAMRRVLEPDSPTLDNRQAYWAYLFGRLRPGATPGDARRQLDAVYRAALLDVELVQQRNHDPRYLAEFRARHLVLTPGARGQSALRADAALPVALLGATTGVVLLIACANVANLLLARGASRAGEIAVRMSLGAGRRRLLRQLLTESCVLAVAGGAAGLLVARLTLAGITAMLPANVAGSAVVPSLDWRVVAFALAAGVATGLAAGAFPALHGTRPDLIAAVRAGAGHIAGGPRAAARFRNTLVGAQIALSMVLLVTAALALRSLVNVSRVALGVRVDHVVTFGVSPGRNGYGGARSQQLFAQLEGELAALPGVTGVGGSIVPMLANSQYGNDVTVEGVRPGGDNNARLDRVSAGYFRLFGVPLLAGREFAAGDRAGRPKVAIVNETFARTFGLGRAAVGKRMAEGDQGPLDLEIVGVVRDAKYGSVKDSVPPVYFTPYAQDTSVGRVQFYVRTAQDPAAVLRGVVAAVARVDPTLPVEGLTTLPAAVREGTTADRAIGTLAGAFAGLATLLAGVGLYGVLAYAVGQRTREIGVRVALGASARAVRALVFGQAGWLVLAGGAVGLVGALVVGHLARAFLFGVEGHDPAAVAAAAAVVAAAGLAAGYFPARRAARVDPMQALRAE
ncbi:hypothetical protein tb265_41760 [Gemmatimonadetes bacterium T265]|nr:hypothetical protein tb265_41760 [Gemmatimonadetes bacterium T265]